MAGVLGEDNLFAGLQEEVKAAEEQEPPKKTRAKKATKSVKVKKVAEPESKTMDEVKEDIQELLDETKPKKTTRPKKTKKVEDLDPVAQAEAEKKQALLMVLMHYSENVRFGEYLKRVAPKELYSKTLAKKSLEELEDLVVRVRFVVNNKNGGPISDGMIKGVFTAAENITTKASKGRVLLQGTTNQLWQDEEFLDLMEQIKLEYLNFAAWDPKIRLAMVVGRTAFMVNAINQHEAAKRREDAKHSDLSGDRANQQQHQAPAQQQQQAPVAAQQQAAPPAQQQLYNLPIPPIPVIVPPSDDPIEKLLGKK